MSKKVRDIVIDADHIAFLVAKSNTYKSGFEKGEDDEDVESMCEALEALSGLEETEVDMKPYQEHFKSIVAEYVLIAEVESICYNWEIGITRVIMSDTTNFRYELFDEYKANRKGNAPDEIMEDLKAWAREYYHFEPNTEADDVVAYYVREGGLGFTTDKDLYKGVEGIWFNSHFKHKSWIRTNKKDAERFFKMQCLSGDGVDGIPALDGVGLITAGKLLDKFGDSWSDMLQIYTDVEKVVGKKPRPVAYDDKYFECMVRLVCMSQWTPNKGIKKWKLKKNL